MEKKHLLRNNLVPRNLRMRVGSAKPNLNPGTSVRDRNAARPALLTRDSFALDPTLKSVGHASSLREVPAPEDATAPRHLTVDVKLVGVSQAQKTVIAARARHRGLNEAIVGATRALDLLQVRDRPGKQSSEYDYSGGLDGCASKMKIGHHFLPSPLQATNEEGGWASYIHLGTEFLTGKRNALPVGFTDSNLFVTAFTAYPLFLIDDGALPEAQRFVQHTLELATKNIQAYKRGEAYSFWQSRVDEHGNTVVGMRGIPKSLLGTLAKLVTSRAGTALIRTMGDDQLGPMKEPLLDWLQRAMDPAQNPIGMDALLNIPNDADDSSVAAAHLLLGALLKVTHSESTGDPEALDEMTRFLDTDPNRMSWIPEPTGAISVWLRDPNDVPFSEPSMGDLSGGRQVLDEGVNANAVFALALYGKTDAPGYAESVQLIERSAQEKQWKKGSAYYPNVMVFPYAVSRAYRDGGAREPAMRHALKRMLPDVLDMFENKTFPSGADKTTDLSTAYGLIFLLNVGEALAKEAGLLDRYRLAIEGSMEHLLESSKTLRVGPRGHRNKNQGLVWNEGVFFSSGPNNAILWDSRAQTTAAVLEAISKYRLGYDQSDSTILEGPRLRLQ